MTKLIIINKLKLKFSRLLNEKNDERKNDVWRIMLFACNGATAFWVLLLIGRWGYYTQNVLQLGVFLAAVLLPMRLLDAFTDPLIAYWFDSSKLKYGKFRFFMITGALLTLAPTLVIFLYPVNPPNIPIGVSYAILTLMYGIMVIGSTILWTATRAGQAIITQAPEQRPVYALGTAAVNNIVSLFIILMLTSDLFGSMQDPFVWRFTSISLAVISLIMISLAVWAISTRDNHKYYSYAKIKEKLKISEFLKVIKRNSALKRLLVAVGTDAFALNVRGMLTIYIYANIIMQRSLIFTIDLVAGLAFGVPIMLIGLYLASKKGSALVFTKIALFQTILALVGFVAVLIFLPADPDYAYSGLTFGVIIVCLLIGLFTSIWGLLATLIAPMTGDLVDYEYTISGKFIPGTIGATITFVEKVSGSLVGLIVTGIMLFSGFSNVGEGSVVPENVFINNRFYYCVLVAVFILPAIGHFITYIVMRGYPITAEVSNKISLDMSEERKLKSS